MRFLFICLVIIFQISESYAQITITNSIFPKAGDTLKTIFTLNVPGGLNVGTTGGPKTWDFSQLTTGTRQQEIYLNPAAGKDFASFPDANLMSRSGGQDLYIKSSANIMEGLGFGGSNPFLDTNLVIKYNKRPVLRKTPVEFITSTSSVGEFRIDLGTDIIPDTLLSTLPIKPDSVRVQFSNTLRGIIDAYGTLKLSGKTFNVLREKAEAITETRIFVKVLGLWLDPVAILGGNIPAGFSDLLGKDTTIVYNFYSDQKKEVILSAEYTPEGTFLGVTYAELSGPLSSVSNQIPDTFRVFPNPVFDYLYLETGEQTGKYMVTVSDLLGRIVFFDIISFNVRESKQIDTTIWPEGNYFVSFFNVVNKKTNTIQVIKK